MTSALLWLLASLLLGLALLAAVWAVRLVGLVSREERGRRLAEANRDVVDLTKIRAARFVEFVKKERGL